MLSRRVQKPLANEQTSFRLDDDLLDDFRTGNRQIKFEKIWRKSGFKVGRC